MISKESANEIVDSLRKAIEIDRRFFVEAKNDPIFLPVRDQVNNLLDQLAQQAKSRAEKRYEECLYLTSKIDFNWAYISFHKDECEKGLLAIKTLLAKPGYSDYLDIETISNDVLKSAAAFLDETLLKSQEFLNRLKADIKDRDNQISKTKSEIKPHALRRVGYGCGTAVGLYVVVAFAMFLSGAEHLPVGAQSVVLLLSGGIIVFIVYSLIQYFKERSKRQKYLPIIEGEETQKRKLEEEILRTEDIIERINSLRESFYSSKERKII